jgi:uncharacterized protein involved in exopolysaccharide biosynthesis
VLHDLRRHATASPDATVLQDRINSADAEISGTLESLLALRSRVVRVSIDSENPERAATLNTSLDDLNARLEALSETMSPPGAGDR